MATSGSTNFNVTRNEIIADALLILGVLGAEETPNSADNAMAARILNSMLKGWQAKGVHLWRNQEASIFLTKGQESYALDGTSASADASNTIVKSTLSADEAALQTVLSITSTTGMTAGDFILVELDDGTYADTTIVSVDSAVQVTITTAIASVAASGNNVYTFTTRMGRPLNISSVRFRSDSDIDRVMSKISREDYFNLPNKDSEGQPVSYYYDPQLSTGKLYVWPAPDAVSGHLRITYSRAIEDLDSASDNPDLPQEWIEAMVFNLAVRLGPIFGKDKKMLESIAPLAAGMLDDVLAFDTENANLSFVLDRRFD